MKDDVLNFIKTHSLIGDNIMGNLVQFVDQQVVSIGVDTIQSVGVKAGLNGITGSSDSDVTLINVYYLGTG